MLPAAADAAVITDPTTVDFGSVEVNQLGTNQRVDVTATCAQYIVVCVKPGRFTPEPSIAGNSSSFTQANNCGDGIFGNSTTTGTCYFVIAFRAPFAGPVDAVFTLGYNTTEANVKTPVEVSLTALGVAPAASPGLSVKKDPDGVPSARKCKKRKKGRKAGAAAKKCRKKRK